MWRVVTWPVRSRPVRRVLLLWLGTQVSRRVRRAGLWSDEEDDDGRSWWPWLLALTVAVLAAGLIHRRRREAGPAFDPPTTSAAATPTTRTADPVRPPVAAPTVAATPSSPQLGVAQLSRAPDELDLASGADVIGRTLAVEDLKVVEGIGPKIEQLLNDSGVHTWHDLSAADVDRLRTILQEAGSRYRMHDPSTWPQQASLLIRGDWEGFRDFSDGERDT